MIEDIAKTELFEKYRPSLKCGFEQIDLVFAECIEEACSLLSPKGVENYLKGASLICMIGRGVEPVLVYLQEMPQIAKNIDEKMLVAVSSAVWDLSKTSNSQAIVDFVQTMPYVSRRLRSHDLFLDYLDTIFDMSERTSGSIHKHIGINSLPSPGLLPLLQKMPKLLSILNLSGLKKFIEYGIKNYNNHPENQENYFSLKSADAKAVLHRERHGTLLIDNERKLGLYNQAFWKDSELLVPYSTEDQTNMLAYYNNEGMRLPDVYDDFVINNESNNYRVKGINRYRAMISHMQAHKLWGQSIIADNFSPPQRMAIECLEDSRVERLAMRKYPGLKKLWLSLHPVPVEGACDSETYSCIIYRLAMLSYAILNPDHGYSDPDVLEFAAKFNQCMESGESSLKEVSGIAISFIARTRRQSDQLPKVFFENSVINYRDDNRHLWIYIEEGDEEETFSDNNTSNKEDEINELPPRHYPEWDYLNDTYKPDWVSLYENLYRQGDASKIDDILQKHSGLAKRLKHILERLKPQNYVRQRYQEEGSELDLDIAIRSLIDYKCDIEPDPRINFSLEHDSRDVAVSILIDLSASVDEKPEGSNQTILEISQESVALLAWSIDQLGDKFAIAGFFSNTRHEVRYQHIKGYSESWGEESKARLAAIEAGLSTRMGAAIRHAGHYLENQKADKKIMLILTDGEPADVDVEDEQTLHEDTKQAVLEVKQNGIYPYAISLDPNADEYVNNIFGNQYTVIDNVEKLPEKLPKIFMNLTK